MSLRLALIAFLVSCFGAIFMILEAFMFEVALNPSLPIIPAALCFTALWLAGYAGVLWNREFSEKEEKTNDPE